MTTKIGTNSGEIQNHAHVPYVRAIVGLCTRLQMSHPFLFKNLLRRVEKSREGEEQFLQDQFKQQEGTVQPFLQYVMKDAMKMCWKTWNKEKENVKLDSNKFDPEVHERIENRGVTAGCHNTAVNIVTASPKVSLKEQLA